MRQPDCKSNEVARAEGYQRVGTHQLQASALDASGAVLQRERRRRGAVVLRPQGLKNATRSVTLVLFRSQNSEPCQLRRPKRVATGLKESTNWLFSAVDRESAKRAASNAPFVGG